ncbi:class II aldolase/adducin family protein [Desulfurococcus mucosus]|uniref:Class II aldolase/adducin family protein n=1 Tax=Desulfurococcus mucosus (strain ATCC 35584 / DSM 2162 / JCM 9187 / O7/1) TaxID=765177 RepID=E8R8V6_DESM0|nr:class II aldolase/adducin family protein [Desulfurococcus mucosus]ADV64932.1 class II aldolase/adducin family protein [Desulfurococcus mucosus DSM 2162]
MYTDLKARIVEVARYLEEHGLNHGRSGNISLRIPGVNHVLITPSGLVKSRLSSEDIVVVDVNGSIVEGHRKPSSEVNLHLAIYRARGDVNAVIHAHTVYATALAVARRPLPPVIEEAILVIGGEVKVAEFAPYGTLQLAENVVKALEGRKAALLANHGVVAVGESLEEALEVLVSLERLSQVYLLSEILTGGKTPLLPPEAVSRLLGK